MSAKHDVHNGWDTFLLQDSTQSNLLFPGCTWTHRGVDTPTHYWKQIKPKYLWMKVMEETHRESLWVQVEDKQEIPRASLNAAFDPGAASHLEAIPPRQAYRNLNHPSLISSGHCVYSATKRRGAGQTMRQPHRQARSHMSRERGWPRPWRMATITTWVGGVEPASSIIFWPFSLFNLSPRAFNTAR